MLKVLVLAEEEFIIYLFGSHLCIFDLRTAILFSSSLSMRSRLSKRELKFLSPLPFTLRVQLRCFKFTKVDLIAGLVLQNRVDKGQRI